MEASGADAQHGGLKAATTYVCTISHVASVLGEDPDLLHAVVSTDDNLSYGNMSAFRLVAKNTLPL